MGRHRFYYSHLAYSLDRTRTQTQISYLWSENSPSIFPQPYFSNNNNHIRENSLRVYKDELRPSPTTFQKNIFQFFFLNKHFNEYFMQSRVKKYSCPDQTFFSFHVESWTINSRDIEKKTTQQNTLWQPY